MIANLGKVGTLLLLTCMLWACGTTPSSTHYLLTATLEDVPASQSPAIGVGPIKIPEYLNRNTLVYRGPGNEIEIAQQSRWAEPLTDGISRVISLNLAGLLDTENVRSFPWHPQRAPDYGVKVRVLRLDATTSEAVLVAEWVVFRPGEDGEVQRRISHHSLPLDTERPVPAQLAPAHSALLYQLSEEIAAAIPPAKSTL